MAIQKAIFSRMFSAVTEAGRSWFARKLITQIKFITETRVFLRLLFTRVVLLEMVLKEALRLFLEEAPTSLLHQESF